MLPAPLGPVIGSSYKPGQVVVIWSEKLIFITTTINMAASDVTHVASSSSITLTLQMNNSAWAIFKYLGHSGF